MSAMRAESQWTGGETATRHPPRRNALMIAAHVVWGAILAAVADLVQPEHSHDSLSEER